MLVRLLLICCIFVSASSDHLIGGSIMVRPKADGAESEVIMIMCMLLHV